jgi:hypothetical protein
VQPVTAQQRSCCDNIHPVLQQFGLPLKEFCNAIH